MIIIRVLSSILASRFHDNLKHARDRLDLNEVFEVSRVTAYIMYWSKFGGGQAVSRIKCHDVIRTEQMV